MPTSLQLSGIGMQFSRARPRFDSGYTYADIERILDDLIDAPTLARFGMYAGLMVSLALGLSQDDAARSPTDYAMLEEPPSVVDARLDAVCRMIAGGSTLIEALEALPANLRRPIDA